MWVGGLQSRMMSGARGGLAAAFAAASLAACAASTYAGIPLEAGAANPELQYLARRAKAGDKHAQLELGIRYEEGRGLPLNLVRAEQLYGLAAVDAEGPLWVYSPPVGNQKQGGILSVGRETKRYGLLDAKERLVRLRWRLSRSTTDSR